MELQIRLLKDCDLSLSDWNDLEEGYLQSFPPEERRSWQELIGEDFAANVYAILAGTEIAGLITLWSLDRCIFIEHFFILAEYRNNGIGQKVVQNIIGRYSTAPILLECEIAYTSELAQRRLSFYKRLGFEVQAIDYLQPPYDKTSEMLPLHLLSTQRLSLEELEHLRDIIYREVYGWKV